MNTILNTLPADYEVPAALVEARELLELATADHQESIEKANGLALEIDRQTQTAADARRAYGAAPSPVNHKAMLGAEQLISDLSIQHEMALEVVTEFEAPLEAAKAHLATVEAAVWQQYRTEAESAKKAQARSIGEALGEIAVILNRDPTLAPLIRGQLSDPTHAALQTLSNRVVRL